MSQLRASDIITPTENQKGNNRRSGHLKIAFFGNFGQNNLGNDSTFRAILYHFRRLAPDADFNCICTGPERIAAAHSITAIPCRADVVKPWAFHSPLARLARKLAVGVPIELYRWLQGLKTLWGTDALITPGTGLLTDAHTLFHWGPYDMFRWSVSAKVCRCKLFFVSVGAGPVYSRIGRFFIRAALSLADFRSYRDESTQRYLKGIGFRAGNDRVYPDLVFSLPEAVIPRDCESKGRRLVVGLGLMVKSGRYSVERLDDFNDAKATNAIYAAYLDTLVEFVKWLLAHEYNVRLLIGDFADTSATQDFRSLLRERSATHDEERIIDEPVESVEDLLSQIAATDLVVATRFHNVLLSLLLNKPVLAISFHHKCSSLMSQMGMSEYCQDIQQLNADKLIEQFCRLEKNAGILKHMMREKVADCRKALDEQYSLIFKDLLPGILL